MRGRGAALAALALGAVLAAACAGSGAIAPTTPGELTNPYLGPEWSAWLVGPIAAMATGEEQREFHALRDDAAAARFAEAFWAARDPDPAREGNPVREVFDERAAQADRRFSESGYLGRRTDRGTVFVLFGEPEGIGFELARREGDPPIELWDYPRDAPPGLHGRPPAWQYRFIRRGDLTVLYRGEEPRRGVQPGPTRF